jgi:hypothetical protein
LDGVALGGGSAIAAGVLLLATPVRHFLIKWVSWMVRRRRFFVGASVTTESFGLTLSLALRISFVCDISTSSSCHSCSFLRDEFSNFPCFVGF